MMKLHLLIITFCLSFMSCSKEAAEFHFLSTTDLHGEMGKNMSSIYYYITQAREAYGDDLILLDCGDNLQGSPEAFFSSYVDTANVSIYSQLFNALDYDALAVGNHDVEAGKNLYDKFYSQVQAPVLCSNIVDKTSGDPLFQPYTIIRKGKYKIALLAICCTEALDWIPTSLQNNMKFQPMQEAAEYWMKKIKRREHPDLVIGMFHAGSSSMDMESAYHIALNVPGFDVIFCGHIHRCNKEMVINNNKDSVYLINADANGRHLSSASIKIHDKGFGKPKVSVTTEIVSMENVPASEEFDQLAEPFINRANIYYDVPISSIAATIYSNDALKGPCAWTSMLHRAYREMAESMGFVGEKAITATIVSPSMRNAILHAGPLTMKDIISIYPYENTLSIIEMTGSEIRDYLEYAFSLLLDFPDNPIYLFDTVSGLTYSVDKANPYGSRVTIKSESNGNPFYSRSSYRVAMNTFRACGGNGHLTKGLGWSPEKMKVRTIAVSGQSIRNMLLNQFSEKPVDIALIADWYYLSK